jgi:Ca2+-binding RTX toxin-like protein
LGTTYYNPRGSVDGTSGPDNAIFDTPITSFVTIDALEGTDQLIVDYRSAQRSSFHVGDIFNSGTFYGLVQIGPYDPQLNFYQFEDVRFLGSNFSSLASGMLFIASGGSITSSWGTFANLEQFRILAGSGNDSIQTGDANDYVSGGRGSDDIRTGGGDDDVYTESGGDYVDMGAGYDHFQGNYSAGSVALTVDIGTILTVSNGVTALNFESLTIGGSSADDLFNVAVAARTR